MSTNVQEQLANTLLISEERIAMGQENEDDVVENAEEASRMDPLIEMSCIVCTQEP